MINTYLAAKGFIYYSTTPIQGLSGPIPGESAAIHVYDLKERKDKVLLEGAQRFALSFDGSKLLYEADGGRDGHTYGIIDAKPDGPKKVGEGALNLGGMKAQINPPEEWKQIFNEVWRQERDYFYEASMNGVDWEKVRDKYSQLLPVRRRPLQPDLHPGRDDRRTFQLAHLRGRRRLSRSASGERGTAGSRL